MLLPLLPCLLLLLPQTSAVTVKCLKLKEAFPACPCSGTNQRPELDCSNLGLDQIPQPPDNFSFDGVIEKLLLVNNSITSLTDDAFSGLSIARVDLSGNAIHQVANDSFRGMTSSLVGLVLEGDGVVAPPVHAFSQIPNLRSLTLRNYGPDTIDRNSEDYYFKSFSRLEEATLDGWPKLYCMEPEFIHGPTGLKKLAFTNMVKLKNFPLGVFNYNDMATLETVVIKHTKINKAMSPNMFSVLAQLKHVDLSYNDIPSVDKDAFKGADSLETIDLSHNLLHIDKTPEINNLPKLVELNLSNNQELTQVPVLSNLGGTANGLTVNLAKCKISSITTNDLSNIPHLTTLDLSENKIETISPDAFDNNKKLQELFLQGQVSASSDRLVLPESLVGSSGTLRQLNLQLMYGDSTSLWNVVSNLTTLEVLDLRSAELDNYEIPPFAFAKLTQLKELYLDYLRVDSITPEILVGPRQSLTVLSLKFMSNLNSLPPCVLYQYQNPVDINLEGTRFKCDDCSVAWIKAAVNNGGITFNQPNSGPTCKDGSSLLTYDFAALSCPSQPQCQDFYTTPKPTPPTTTPRTNGKNKPTVGVISYTNSLRVDWQIVSSAELTRFEVEVKKPTTGLKVTSQLLLDTSARTVDIQTDILPDTSYRLVLG